MTEKTEYEKACDRIKANAQRVDIIAERQAFEAWQEQCGLLPIDPRHRDEKTGYRDTITGRNLDRWDAWLARAVADREELTHLKLKGRTSGECPKKPPQHWAQVLLLRGSPPGADDADLPP